MARIGCDIRLGLLEQKIVVFACAVCCPALPSVSDRDEPLPRASSFASSRYRRTASPGRSELDRHAHDRGLLARSARFGPCFRLPGRVRVGGDAFGELSALSLSAPSIATGTPTPRPRKRKKRAVASRPAIASIRSLTLGAMLNVARRSSVSWASEAQRASSLVACPAAPGQAAWPAGTSPPPASANVSVAATPTSRPARV